MTDGDLHCDRLSDLPIDLAGGGTINLSHFCGQKLIVFFCPADDSAAAAREIQAYEAMAAEFEHAGAWLIGICDFEPEPRAGPEQSFVHLGIDPDDSAFRAMTRFVPDDLGLAIEQGATFLIDRDGGIRIAWPGCGHAAQALAIVRERP